MRKSFYKKDGTAQGVAKQRFIETLAEPDKRVIDDPYAERFVVGSGLIKLMGHKLSVWITHLFAPGFHEHLISRTRFIDDLVQACAAEGAEQYVILGAGYDLRAHRLQLPSTLKVFEVDQSEVQARKRAKLPRDLREADSVTYVDIDFNHQSLSERLLAAGYDQSKRTIFTLEGVSQYIPKDALAATVKELSVLGGQSGATFFVSYVDQLFDTDPRACVGKGYPNAEKRARLIKDLAAKVGEPWISAYTSQEMSSLLSDNGFSMKENKTLADLNARYFAPVGRALSEEHILKLEHFVVAQANA